MELKQHSRYSMHVMRKYHRSINLLRRDLKYHVMFVLGFHLHPRLHDTKMLPRTQSSGFSPALF